ncbi:MAG: endonuclease III [Hyphomicrobiales bacterium]|nr:MAG: endonuclease III [Hyphomicrobiales bacterium]
MPPKPKAKPPAKKAIAAKKPAPARPKAGGSAKSPRLKEPAAAARVGEIFHRLATANPEPKGELEHVNPYTLLVAVVLSAQATDAGVNKATRALFAAADTPQKMLALGEDKVRDHIKTIGLFRNKAKNVIALSEKLVAEHGGEVPRDREALETLPGVGRKTANVVLNIAFGEHTLAVDTHVFRLAHRLDFSKGKTPLDVELDLLKIIPAEYMRHAHHWLILHGRYICQARKPLCDACVISDLCHAPEKWFDGLPPDPRTQRKAAP